MSARHAHAIPLSYPHSGRVSNALQDAQDPCHDNPHSPQGKCVHLSPDDRIIIMGAQKKGACQVQNFRVQTQKTQW